jgi:hypothetical protein
VNDYEPKTTPNTQSNFRDTIAFLKNEGFLEIGLSTGNPNQFDRVDLTMKGLKVLNSVPDILKENESLGDKSKNIVKSGFKEAGKEVVKTVVSEIIKAATF